MRIDRSDPADGPDDAHIARHVRSAADDLDAAGKDKGNAVHRDGSPESSPPQPDSTLRTERTMAYRAVVDAAYRRYAIDRTDTQVGIPEHETATSVESGTDVEDSQRYLASPMGRLNDKGHRTPATATGGDGSIGNGGGAKPPTGDAAPDPEGDDNPEGVNGGLGELVSVNAKDRAADLLAERLNGQASVRFTNGPTNEFDTVSAEYVAQAKPANFTLNKAFRNQAQVTFKVALQSGRAPYFQFDGPPGPGVLRALSRYADRYGIEPVIDLTPLGRSNA